MNRDESVNIAELLDLLQWAQDQVAEIDGGEIDEKAK